MAETTTLLEAALSYARRGWPVFPCNGKRPYTTNGFKDATTNLGQVMGWWRRWPNANIGVPTGRVSGLLVLDVDGDAGKAALKQLGLHTPATVSATTGGGGLHFYFAHPGGNHPNTAGVIGDHIDTRGDGGYVVVPPSVTTGAYEWLMDPENAGLAVPPPWVLAPGNGSAKTSAAPPLPERISAGQRDTLLTSLAGSLRRRGASEVAILAALLAENEVRCDPPLSKEQVQKIAHSVGHYEPAESLPQEEPAEAGTSDSPFVDWRTFWAREREPAEWVFEDVLARGRGHAIYAKHKQGKSLLTLYMAAKIATSEDDMVVVYLDYEMGEEDLYERLEGMGYGARDDLSRLRYALLPLLPPLDTDAGCAALSAMLDGVQAEYPDMHQVVIIDTIGRAVKGPEDEADTWRDFHRHAGMMLKRRGCTWARLDHGGKDIAKGQRGSSGKGDDPDVVWRLERTQSGVTLHRDVARMAWVPEKVTFKIVEPPLSFEPAPFDWPAGTWETIEVLNRLGVPLDASVRDAQAALKEADEGRRQAVVRAALRARKEQEGQAE